MHEGFSIDYSKWKRIALEEAAEEEDEVQRYEREVAKEPVITMDQVYAKETGRSRHVDRLQELKIKMAVEAYEKRRPADSVMHHYWVKEAGDPEAIGEYFPTGDERNGVPLYQNQNGLVLSREAHGSPEVYSWVIGSVSERRPLYGVKSDDLSAPTLGWQAFTAPEPVPVIRYFSKVAAGRTFKDRGNRAFGQRKWQDAETWYSQALKCGIDQEEHAEPYALLLSNRSETRMRLQDFRGAADDADEALKHIRSFATSTGDSESLRQLHQKTVLRLGRALHAMNRMSEAMRLLHHERRNYPQSQEMQRMAEATRLALRSVGRGTPSQSRGERHEAGMDSTHGRKLMEYVANVSEDLQKEFSALKAAEAESSFALPSPLMTILSKLEYILINAQQVEREVLESLQALLQINGVLRCVVNIIQAQWRANLEGKFVDLFKLPGAATVASVAALICEGNEPNLRLLAENTHCFWALLGGCNCKVEKEVCERLISVVHGLWERCRSQSLELVQTHSVVVERAAFYLSQALQASPHDDSVSGPDSPMVSPASREQAALLLLDVIACGGRLKKRTLRGIMPQLASRSGQGGFFTRPQACVRTLGELVAKNAIDDPQLVSAEEVTQMLRTMRYILDSAPQKTVVDAEQDKHMVYMDLDGFPAIRYVALLLEVISKTLEHKLLKDRELERETYEAAFNEGDGLLVVLPLLQALPQVAEHALSCLSTISQTYLENVEKMVRLGALEALMSVPSPKSQPVPSHIEASLAVPAARRSASKLLMQCTAAQGFMDVLQANAERFVKELVKLGIQLWMDGAASTESFQDIIHVFHAISLQKPDILSTNLREAPMLQLLLRLEKANVPATPLAADILKTLRKDRSFKRAFAPVKKLFEEGYDPELELKLRQHTSMQMTGQVN
ncbi:PDK3 [Symbiodinium sp. CCMP2456]|nr:PDK3 [Symbiodinium sp. CCMP2456]